ncbi:rhodanese-like domain-containing protein [Filimonas effusa]|uniref:Rhodanese-like domain-containing protein n=1 Tax=Filimonas effusa TaxID=2508721 RepID=A0A4V1MAC0_9BACT|nr:rhodanese-like domain-containing protein [Filimonas effusa]RXK85346.1 rhodanese-like domain-containing protein [Filimonas effusa]
MNTITVEALKARLDNGEQIHLLDVREDSERAEFNIGGTHLPLGKVQAMQVEDIEGWKGDEVIIYCRSGNRSGVAALLMEQAGFKNTVNLVGGMLAWRDKFGE